VERRLEQVGGVVVDDEPDDGDGPLGAGGGEIESDGAHVLQTLLDHVPEGGGDEVLAGGEMVLRGPP
jgi:hypothetical protein